MTARHQPDVSSSWGSRAGEYERRSLRRSIPRLTLAAMLLGAAVFMASHHPLFGMWAVAGVALLFIGETRRRGLWLFLAPAALPLSSLAPWTGWVVFDEFDLLMLSLLAAAYARPGLPETHQPETSRSRWLVLPILFGLLTCVALWRGLADAGPKGLGWYDSYPDPLNSLRVAKPLLHALLAIPLLRAALRADADRTMHGLCAGMVTGVAIVTLFVLWERAAFPGLFDFSAPYRTVGPFWEMHVGGAAIDAYLVMAVPFVAWALRTARTPGQWTLAGLLAVGVGYACLTTFSRGVYAGVAGALIVLGMMMLPRRGGTSWSPRWRRVATSCLATLLVAEAAAITLAPGSYLWSRLRQSSVDLDGRLEHWQNGLGLLERPAQWLFGIGLGRLPAHYAARVPGRGFSGEVRWIDEDGGGAVRIAGPLRRQQLGGLYQLTQRVPPGSQYRARLLVRGDLAAQVLLEVCERHLLYDARCQSAVVRVDDTGLSWKQVTADLSGTDLARPDSRVPRAIVFTMSVLTAGAAVEVAQAELLIASGKDVLANGSFDAGLARWYPTAQLYFQPWHIDNLYLEVLIERGLPALLAWLAIPLIAIGHSARLAGGSAAVQAMAAALSGGLIVGIASSILDAARGAFIFHLLAFALLAATQASARLSSR